jgi:hypothetical protein
MNRIVAKFAQLKAGGKNGLVVYIGAGDPNLEATHQLALAFDRAGVGVLELGVPLSDPLANPTSYLRAVPSNGPPASAHLRSQSGRRRGIDPAVLPHHRTYGSVSRRFMRPAARAAS